MSTTGLFGLRVLAHTVRGPLKKLDLNSTTKWTGFCYGSGIQRCKSTTTPDHTIRLLQTDDIPGLHSLLSENQWNIDKAYLNTIFSTDPSGLFVIVSHDGTILGHAGIMTHGPYLASSGMIIMKEGYRGQGFGHKLSRVLIEAMGDRNVGGNSLTDRITFYQQFGWNISSFNVHINQGPVGDDYLQFCKDSSKGYDVEVVPTRDLEFDDVVNYDAGIHTVPRKRYLYNWIFHESAHSFTAIQNGRVTGYCVLRPADVGWKLYPLYADTKQVARALFAHVAPLVPRGEDIIFSTPIQNENAAELVNGNDVKPIMKTTRLYNKWPVHVDIGRVFGLSSIEFGIA